MERWSAAMGRGDHEVAQRALLAEDGPTWRAEADRLAKQHGRVRVIQNDDVVPDQGAPFKSVRVTWADGHDRCLRVRLPADDRLDLLDGGWQDCAAVPFNPTPPPGP